MTATVEQTTWALHQLPGWAALLPVALKAPRRTTSLTATSADPAALSLLNLEIHALLDETVHHVPMPVFGPRGAIPAQRMGIRPALATWAATIELDAIDGGAPLALDPLDDDLDVGELCAWLTQRDLQAWAEAHFVEWPEYSDDVLSLATRTYAAIAHLLDEGADDAPDPDPICGTCHQGRLREWFGLPGRWSCDHCERVMGVHPVTLPEAARKLGHPRRTLYRWAGEGRFVRILGDDGAALYDLGEIAGEVARARLAKALAAADSPAGPATHSGAPTDP